MFTIHLTRQSFVKKYYDFSVERADPAIDAHDKALKDVETPPPAYHPDTFDRNVRNAQERAEADQDKASAVRDLQILGPDDVPTVPTRVAVGNMDGLLSSTFAAEKGTPYTVKSGDTLGKIARDHGMTVSELAKLNDITNVNLIRPGKTLQLTSETPVAAAAAPSAAAPSQGVAAAPVAKPIARPATQVAARPAAGPDAVTDDIKRKGDLQNQIGQIDKAIAEFKQKLAVETPQHNSPEKQTELANLGRTISQLEVARGNFQAQLQPLIDADNRLATRENNRLADASRQRAKEIAALQEQAQYAALSPNERIAKDLDIALAKAKGEYSPLFNTYTKRLSPTDAKRKEELRLAIMEMSGKLDQAKQLVSIDNNINTINQETQAAAKRFNQIGDFDLKRKNDALIADLRKTQESIKASLNAGEYTPTMLAKALKRPTYQNA